MKTNTPDKLAEVPGKRPTARWGKTLIRRSRSHRSQSRDVKRHTSDQVWALVERMLEGDADAAIVLDDMIEEGISAGRTKFVKITEKSYKLYGRQVPEKVRTGEYAAITPGRQIVLFGVKNQWNPGGGYTKRGYISRYRIGDAAEYHSYNLVYFGTITAISDKRVTIDKKHGQGKASLSIDRFSTKNWDPNNLADGIKRNREWSD